MKYVNPGLPQLFEYQNLNKLSIGVEEEFSSSNTGYFVKLTSNDTDVFYKTLDNVKEFYILFDIKIEQPTDSSSFVKDWVKVFDFYNDSYPNKNLILKYKQFNQKKYQFSFFTNEGKNIGEVWYVNANEINTFEFHIIRNIITNIEVFLNCKSNQTIIDNSIGDDIVNRFNFYCQYVDEITTCLSHIIYNDKSKIGNERIKFLKTDVSQRIIANGSQGKFTITEILDNKLYKDLTGFGVLSIVENGDINKSLITEYLDNNAIVSQEVKENSIKYSSTYLETDPNTLKPFDVTTLTNRKILVDAKSE